MLPAYFYNIFGLSLAASAGMSVIFTVTGVLGQLIWPSLSDVIGRKTTLVICGLWMAVSVGVFQLAGTIRLVIEVQLLFGLVANAVWPIYYATASDAAPSAATSTANSIITTAMFVGGGISPALMGVLIAWGGLLRRHGSVSHCWCVAAVSSRSAGVYVCANYGSRESAAARTLNLTRCV